MKKRLLNRMLSLTLACSLSLSLCPQLVLAEGPGTGVIEELAEAEKADPETFDSETFDSETIGSENPDSETVEGAEEESQADKENASKEESEKEAEEASREQETEEDMIGASGVFMGEEKGEIASPMNEILYYGNCGPNLTWTYDETGTLTIEGSGDMFEVEEAYQCPWSQLKGSIDRVTTLVLPDGLTSISAYAFDCLQMESVRIPSGVTSIGAHAFDACRLLKTVSLPAGLKEIGDYAFRFTDSLESIAIPASVTRIGTGAFWGTNASAILVDAANTSYTSVDGVLYNFDKTSLINYPKNKSGWEFTIPEGVRTIEPYAFEASMLLYLTLPVSVKEVKDGALSVLKGTVEFTGPVPIFGEEVLDYGDVTVVYPPGDAAWDALAAQYVCKSGTVTWRGKYAEASCGDLLYCPINQTTCEITGFNFRDDINWEQRAKEPLIIPEQLDGYTVVSVADYALSARGALKQIRELRLPNTLTHIGESAFSNWEMTSLTLPDSLKEIDYYAFGHCNNLTTVTIPKNVNKFGPAVFAGCEKMTEIRVAATNRTYTSSEGILYNKAKTSLVECPCNHSNNITYPSTLREIEVEAFSECRKLEKITLPSTVTNIKERAFASCKNVTTINLPGNLTWIGNAAFMSCTSLKNLRIPANVAYVGARAFLNDSALAVIAFTGDCPAFESDTFLIDGSAKGLHKGYYLRIRSGWDLNQLTEQYEEVEWLPVRNMTQLNELFLGDQRVNPFKDIQEGTYYYDAVLWAVEKGITNGTTQTQFAPDQNCTRAQVVAFLWRANGCPQPADSRNPFVDVSPNSYYYQAVLWAAQQGITSGVDGTHFMPDRQVRRCEFVTFLWRSEGKPAVSVANPFVDVTDGPFKDAILWAYNRKITLGKDATHFEPDKICTRAQVVTFLYRNTYN